MEAERRESERVHVYTRERERERERLCVCLCVCVCKYVSVCVHVQLRQLLLAEGDAQVESGQVPGQVVALAHVEDLPHEGHLGHLKGEALETERGREGEWMRERA